MLKIFRRDRNENGNNMVFALGSVAVLVLLFGFAIDSIRFMHVRTTVQQSLDRSAVSWLTAYNYAEGNHTTRVATANATAQQVYRDNISAISDMLYCYGECGQTIRVVGEATTTTVDLTVDEDMNFVYLDSIVGADGTSLEELINNNESTGSYFSDAIIGNPVIP